MTQRPVPLTNVNIDDSFWSPRLKTVREITIPYQWDALNDRAPGAVKSGAVRNLKIAAGKVKGDPYGMVFQDSDLAKWLEAAAYSLTTHPDKKLERTVDNVVNLLEARAIARTANERLRVMNVARLAARLRRAIGGFFSSC